MNIFLKSLTIILLVLLSSCDSKDKLKTPKNPNILFICVDDLRPEIGANGKSYMKTPNMDALAAEGTLFTNQFVQVPTCGASRFSMLTSRRPSKRVHLKNNVFEEEISIKKESEIPETFIHHFKRNNYYTVGIGKISHSVDGLLYGYEEQPSDKMELPFSWNEIHFNAGKWKTGWNAFFGYADGSNRQSMNRLVKPYEMGDVGDDGYPDGLTTKLAIEKLGEFKNNEKPFFLGVGFFKPHLPFNAPKKYWDLYDRDSIPVSPNPIIPKNTSGIGVHNSGEFNGYKKGEEKAAAGKQVSDRYAKKIRHAYFASVSYIDAQIGKLLQELKNLKLDDNTIVVIWGDHGWNLGDQTIWGKHAIFENSLNSALIVKVPGAKKTGINSNDLIEAIDLYPTLCELTGLKIPESVEGKSFATYFNDEPYQPKKAVYSYWNNGITLRTAQYRLTRYHKGKNIEFELYDHKNDPEESINIASSNPDIVQKLLPLLKEGNRGLIEDF